MVFENRVLRGMFGPKREKVTGDWSRFHNEELRNLYLLNVTGVIKSRKKWVQYVAHMRNV
jgi:hypothetical protein